MSDCPSGLRLSHPRPLGHKICDRSTRSSQEVVSQDVDVNVAFGHTQRGYPPMPHSQGLVLSSPSSIFPRIPAQSRLGNKRAGLPATGPGMGAAEPLPPH